MSGISSLSRLNNHRMAKLQHPLRAPGGCSHVASHPRVVAGGMPQIGLDGLFLLSPDTQRNLRKFPLEHVSRWARRGNMLNLYTRTPVDVEERTITLQGDDRTIGSVLDTLTSCCMQCVASLPLSLFLMHWLPGERHLGLDRTRRAALHSSRQAQISTPPIPPLIRKHKVTAQLPCRDV